MLTLVSFRARIAMKRHQDPRPIILRDFNYFGIIGILYVFYLAARGASLVGPWWQWEYLGVHHLEDFLVLPICGVFMFTIGRVKGYTAALGVWFLLGIHEYFWYFSFIIISIYTQTYYAPSVQDVGLNARWFGTIVQVAEGVGIGIYLIALKKQRGKIPWKYFLVMAAVYAVWLLMGFHIRTGYHGETTWWNDPIANMTEIASWVIAGVAFCALEIQDMRKIDLSLTAWIGELINLLITKLQKMNTHGFFQGQSPRESAKEEKRRSGRASDRDSNSIAAHRLRARQQHHQRIDCRDDSMAGGSRSNHRPGNPNLRRHRDLTRDLPPSKAILGVPNL